MPASRRARAMILAPRSCPSSPGLATTTRIFLLEVADMGAARDCMGSRQNASRPGLDRGGAVDPLTCALLAALLAGGAPGGKSMEVAVQDDAAFLHGSPERVRADARRLKALGADRLRITAGWSELAPRARSKKRPPAPFDAKDSRTYPQAP